MWEVGKGRERGNVHCGLLYSRRGVVKLQYVRYCTALDNFPQRSAYYFVFLQNFPIFSGLYIREHHIFSEQPLQSMFPGQNSTKKRPITVIIAHLIIIVFERFVRFCCISVYLNTPKGAEALFAPQRMPRKRLIATFIKMSRSNHSIWRASTRATQ